MRIRSLFLASGKQRKIVLAAVLLLGLTISAFSMSRWATTRFEKAIRGKAFPNTAASSNPPVSALQNNGQRSGIKVEIVTLRQWGFEPKEITRPKGQFRLAVNNQSQLAESLTFSMLRETGNKLKEVKLDHRGKHRWNSIFDLNPGSYQLVVNERPDWICRFNITAN